jgi:PKD repeat protein
MKKKFLPIFIIIFLLNNQSIVFADSKYVFETDQYFDEQGDGVDFNECFYGNTIIPMPIPLDIESISLSLESIENTDEKYFFVDISLVTPPLPHHTFTVEVGINIDNDPSTGVNEPFCFYNSQGMDYDVGVEVVEGNVAYTWIDRYEDGNWNRIDENTANIMEKIIHIEFPISVLGSPLESSVMVYLISEGGLDMAPGLGEPPIFFNFHYLPEGHIDFPEFVEEGSELILDASTSVSRNGGINFYEWDLDDNGVYEEAHQDPLVTFTGKDDGEYTVRLKVTDNAGFIDIVESQINVLNTPPHSLVIDFSGELLTGEEIKFTASAEDLGEDELYYEWEIGDTSFSGNSITYVFTEEGIHSVILKVTDDEGLQETTETNVDVTSPSTPTNGGDEPEPKIDPVLIILVIMFGIAGWFIYDYFFRGKKGDKKPKKEDEKDFCKEHPEVVEEEQKKCDEAMEALDDALGPLEEKFDDYEDTWRNCTAEIGRLIGEFDIALAVIASLTKSESKLYKDAAKVQEIAGKVTGYVGKVRTIAKEGAEAAAKEFAQDMAKEASKNAASELSQFVSDLLSLEEWAMSEIGIGIAKLITGIDPQQEASDIRKDSLDIVNALESWISDPEAYQHGFQGITLHDFIDDAQQLIDDINKALEDFENAVAGFRCVECELTPDYLKHIRDMINKLNGWMRAFGDLIDQIEQRLNQAIAMWRLDKVYDHPYQRVSWGNRQIRHTQKVLRDSAERKKN